MKVLKHGHCTRKNKHPLYSVWIDMKNRCYNSNIKYYCNYGGRGIEVCNAWKNNFKIFYDFCINHDWESGLQIDRIDNDGDYCPENCRFITHRQNSLNNRILNSRNSSGYRGISLDKSRNKWVSRITVKGKQTFMRRFNTKQQAVEGRNNYIIEHNLQHEYKIQTWRNQNGSVRKVRF